METTADVLLCYFQHNEDNVQELASLLHHHGVRLGIYHLDTPHHPAYQDLSAIANTYSVVVIVLARDYLFGDAVWHTQQAFVDALCRLMTNSQTAISSDLVFINDIIDQPPIGLGRAYTIKCMPFEAHQILTPLRQRIAYLRWAAALSARPVTPAQEIPVPQAYLAERGFHSVVHDDFTALIPPLCMIDQGIFLMGPERFTIFLDSYLVGSYPVTVAEYQRAVLAGAVTPPQLDTLSRPPYRFDWASQQQDPTRPVVGVTWFDAVAYTVWLAQMTGQPWRLLTEAEWEKAAHWNPRLKVSTRYPWGNDWIPERSRLGSELQHSLLAPIGSFAERGDASHYGLHDLTGNVSEWTSSIYALPPYTLQECEDAEDPLAERVVCGIGWDYPYWQNFVTLPTLGRRTGYPPSAWWSRVGFRLARDAPKEQATS